MKYKVNIAYDGSGFSGFAKQPNKRTVESELVKYLNQIYGEKIKIVKSSRTDSFVHALSYIFTYETKIERDIETVKNFLNSRIEDIFVKTIELTSDNFNPQFDAKSRTYLYKIYKNNDSFGMLNRNYHLWYTQDININLLKKYAKEIVGTRDFSSFTAREKYEDPVRTINYIKITSDNDYVYIEINGNGFLRWMIRNIVGALLAVNEGKINREEFIDLIENPVIGKAKWKARASGLYKIDTKY